MLKYLVKGFFVTIGALFGFFAVLGMSIAIILAILYGVYVYGVI